MASHPLPGQPAPPFDLPDGQGEAVTLEGLLAEGRPLVVLFYPGDFTPVCTKEMCSFRDGYRELCRLGATVVGISTDSVDSHERFQRTHHLPFPLLSDYSGEVCRRYGALGLFGKAKRATFIIDPQGIVRFARIQLPVFRPKVEDVAAALRDLVETKAET